MLSKRFAVSCSDSTGWRILRALDRLSLRSASERVRTRFTMTSQSGRKRSRMFSPIQLAKASFSQRSSHQAMVTRLPNHWWAISWAQTLAHSCCTVSAGALSEATIRLWP
jgi:hypothetical protein